MRAKIIIDGTLYDCPYCFTSFSENEEEKYRCLYDRHPRRCSFRNGHGCLYVIPLNEALERIKNK